MDFKASYSNQVRQTVVDRILLDKQSIVGVQESMERDFLLRLSSGYIYNCLDHRIKQFNGLAFRHKVRTEFSGTMCIDEIHLGGKVLLLATDPVADNPIAAALVASNDSAHMLRFLKNLKNQGFTPRLVTSDRSHLYPSALAEVWPQAEHQLCVFHTVQDVNRQILNAVRRVRRAIKPKRINKGMGRPSKQAEKKVKELQRKQAQADKLFRRRHLIVTKRTNMSKADEKVLGELLQLSPTLATLRAFADDLYELFAMRRTPEKAWSIWRRMRRNNTYLANSDLQKALDILCKENMRKLLCYLDEPPELRSRIRTNNHVERCNRKIRYLEKVRYKWRKRRTIVRHILLQFDTWLKYKEFHAATAA